MVLRQDALHKIKGSETIGASAVFHHIGQLKQHSVAAWPIIIFGRFSCLQSIAGP